MNVPLPELRNAEKKCNMLAQVDEDFLHIVDQLQRRYSAIIRVQIIRPIIGGGAGPEQIILAEVESRQVDT